MTHFWYQLRLQSASIPLCKGLSGTIEDLSVDPNYIPEEFYVPIDTLVADLSNNDETDDIFTDATGNTNRII